MNPSKYLIFFTIVVIWLGHFLVDMMLGIWPVYKTLEHLDLAKAGLIGGVCAFVGEGLQILFGSLSDRGYRKVLILGGVIATTSNAFFVYVEDYAAIFWLYLLTSIGSGAFHPAGASMMGGMTNNRKGLMISLFTTGGFLGMAVSQLIYTQVHFRFEGQTVWMALPAVFLVIFGLFILASGKMEAEQAGRKPFDLKVFVQFFRNRHLRLLYFVQVCNAALLWGTMFLLPDLLSTRGYEPWIAFGGGHMVYILGGVVMMVPAGYLADRYSSRIVILVSSIVSMILLYILLVSPVMGDEMTLLLLFGMGASLTVVNPVSVASGTRLAPNQKGMVSAFLMGLVWCVSEGIGQGGGGLLTKLFEEDAPAKALAVLGVLFLVSISLAVQLPQKESEEVQVEYV